MKPSMYSHVVIVIVAAMVCATTFADDALRDPTQPPRRPTDASATAAPRELNLQAILRFEDRYVAIVDGEVVRAGDRIGSTTIREITTDSVRYSRDGRDHTVQLTRRSAKVRQQSADRLGMNHE